MAKETIRVTEGDDQLPYTITVKRAGSAVDLTLEEGEVGGVKLYAHADGEDLGTNQIDGVACTFSDATNGVVIFTFLTAHTDIAAASDLKGSWALKLYNGTKTEWTKQEPFEIVRNPFAAVA